jgi:hypothetical protein
MNFEKFSSTPHVSFSPSRRQKNLENTLRNFFLEIYTKRKIFEKEIFRGGMRIFHEFFSSLPHHP